jgi:SAM-dependent methyltransferase
MAEFDDVASSYEDLLKDPIRDRFSTGTGFFHKRKLLLIKEFLQSQGALSKRLDWVDIGCGKGDLLKLGVSEFATAKGCDVSVEMLKECEDLDVRVQEDPGTLPFADASADFVTAVCVYHHIPVEGRAAVTAEVSRILKPGGVFSIIEHNPWNPATRLIVSRTPVDADAILLRASETASWMKSAGLKPIHREFFLYLPESIYYKAPWFERMSKKIPLGGQYAVFGKKPLVTSSAS